MSNTTDNKAVSISVDEFDKATALAVESKDTFSLKLRKPIVIIIGDTTEEVSELHFDFSTLTGNDSLAIERELSAIGRPVIVASMSGEYLIRMAIRSCSVKIGMDDMGRMGIGDFNRIKSAARNFLLKSEL